MAETDSRTQGEERPVRDWDGGQPGAATWGRWAGPEVAAVERWVDRWHERIDDAARAEDRPMLRKLRTFGAWPTVLVDLVLLAVVAIISSFVLLGGAVAIIGWHDGDFSSALSASTAATKVLNSTQDWLKSPVGLAAAGATTELDILLVLYWRLLLPHIMTWTDLGFGRNLRDRPLRACGIGVGLGITALVLSGAVVWLLQSAGLDTNGQADAMKAVHRAPLQVFLPFAFTAAITAPLAEETFFRGYLLRAMTVQYGFAVGLACSSIAFGVFHLLGGVTFEAVGLVVIGAILAYGYSRTGNPLTNMTAHMVNNVIGLVVLYYAK